VDINYKLSIYIVAPPQTSSYIWPDREHLEHWGQVVHDREHLEHWGQVVHGHKKAGPLGPAQFDLLTYLIT
jgi:hypothetical protein